MELMDDYTLKKNRLVNLKTQKQQLSKVKYRAK